jgi:hypothetical protein
MEALLFDYQLELAFGVLLNVLLSLGFGLYKFYNVDFSQMTKLIYRYPIKPNYVKTIAFWLLPYARTCQIFYELYTLQKTIDKGKSVYDYIENKLSKEFARQNSVK